MKQGPIPSSNQLDTSKDSGATHKRADPDGFAYIQMRKEDRCDGNQVVADCDGNRR